MKFPLVICAGETSKIASPDFFSIIGMLDLDRDLLEIAVTSNRKSNFKWILDADGIFYDLILVRLLPLNFWQRIGLRRAREQFRIIPGRDIRVSEFRERISGLHDLFVEAPDVSILKEILRPLPPDQLCGREQMLELLGE